MFHHHSFRILVVEDDFDTRSNLCDILELDGYEVDAVRSVAETLSHSSLRDFAAIILDRHLPDGRADELLPQLSRMAPNAARVIVTGAADLEGTIAAIRSGAADYLLKPIRPELLRTSLGRIRKLRDAEERAARSERLAMIGQVVASVAHESRNMLQRIQSRVDLMAMSLEGQPELLEDLQAIENANTNLRTMFEELREFSAPITLNREACRLDHCVQRAWKNVRDAAPKSTATVNIQVAADHHCLVDELRMEQVFRNLFENAIGACESQPHIDVTSSLVNLHGQDAVRIVVRDNGPGFSEETRRKAFEPFFTTKSKGTGLGLAISKRIVEAHDGRMAIDASIHNGAAIKIAIPLLADPVPACAEKLRVPIGSV